MTFQLDDAIDLDTQTGIDFIQAVQRHMAQHDMPQSVRIEILDAFKYFLDLLFENTPDAD